MIVYRVEHKDTKMGPYNGTYGSPLRDLQILYSWSNPEPDKDPKLAPQWNKLSSLKDYIFGFSSLEQYNEWFFDSSERLEMKLAGYVLRVYEAPTVICGTAQVVFHAPTSSSIDTKEIEYES